MLAQRGGAKSFGRVRVTHDELKQSNSEIDFAELIEKQAAGRFQQLPAPEEEVAERRPGANVPAQLQTMKNDGIAGDDILDGEDDDDTAKNSNLRRKGIFEDTIAKWSCLNCLGGDSDNGGDDRSGGDADDVSDESNEYDHDDGFIDNSELVAKFTSRAIAKHTHKKQRNKGSGFYMAHNDMDNDIEEDQDQDQDQDQDNEADQVGDQDEENLGDNGVAGGMSVADDEPVHFDERSGPFQPLSGKRQTLSQTRGRGHNKCSNCGQLGHNKRRCGGGDGGQAVEGAQNTGKRKQGTPSGSSRSLKASPLNVSSSTSGSTSSRVESEDDFPTSCKLDMGSASAQRLPASTACSFRAGDNGAVTGASGDAQDSCNQCGKSVASCKCTFIVID